MKPNLYLDIDGVLLFRNRTDEWLFDFILSNRTKFNRVFFLSCWTRHGTCKLLYEYHPTFKKLKATPLKWGKLKTEAIDWSMPFIWIEDGVLPEERRIFNLKAKEGQQLWEIRNALIK